MKRTVFSAVFLIFIGLGTAVVGGPDAPKDGFAITGGTSAEASQGIGPNGTNWKTTLNNLNNSCMAGNQSTEIEFSEFMETGNFTEVEFSGTIKTSNPCQELTMEVSEESEDVYRVELVEKSTQRKCVTCIGALRFEGSFAAEDDYRLTVVHNDEEVFNSSTEGFHQDNSEETSDSRRNSSGFWESLKNLFNNFF